MYHILLQFKRNSNSSASSASMKFNPALAIISLSKFGRTCQFLKPLFEASLAQSLTETHIPVVRLWWEETWDNMCECLKFKLRKEKRKNLWVTWWLPEQRHVVASGDADHFF